MVIDLDSDCRPRPARSHRSACFPRGVWWAPSILSLCFRKCFFCWGGSPLTSACMYTGCPKKGHNALEGTIFARFQIGLKYWITYQPRKNCTKNITLNFIPPKLYRFPQVTVGKGVPCPSKTDFLNFSIQFQFPNQTGFLNLPINWKSE